MLDTISSLLSEFFGASNSLAKIGFFGFLNQVITEVIEKVRKGGMYGVLDYESVLELMGIKGHKALFCKREKVCYLQVNILAFQDQAWGAGKILIDYQ